MSLCSRCWSAKYNVNRRKGALAFPASAEEINDNTSCSVPSGESAFVYPNGLKRGTLNGVATIALLISQ